MLKRNFLINFCLISFSLSLLQLLGQGNINLEISDLDFNEIRYGGFLLAHEKEIHIKALGAGKKLAGAYARDMNPANMFAYAWIIDANSREVLWQMDLHNSQRYHDSKFLRRFDDHLRLPGGRYEVYFTLRQPWQFEKDHDLETIGEMLKKLLSISKKEDYESQCFIRISGVDDVYSEAETQRYRNEIGTRAVALISAYDDDESYIQRFTLTQPGYFMLYSIGEAYQEERFDYGWLIREDNRQKIWDAIIEDSRHAGGARKNRIWKRRIYLEAGDYALHFQIDDSHSPDGWNSDPPYDPWFWGVGLFGIPGEYKPTSIKAYNPPESVEILGITRIGNDRAVREGIEVRSPIRVRVYAIGEGTDGDMYDYGWISDAVSGKTIWKMRYRSTDHAGGADKNRSVEDVILLQPGTYWINYVTDGSHAYRDWNSRAPRDARRWGISLYAVDRNFDKNSIGRLKNSPEHPLAELVKVGDNEQLSRPFKIKQPMKLRVLAIGEGDNGEMYDYGWIENLKTGQIIWKMRYHKTQHAGGARKNRLIDQIISLSAGEYQLLYQSDGSHSYNDWNSAAPAEPRRWGISLYSAGSSAENFESLDFVPQKSEDYFIDLTGIGDDELVHRGFELTKDSRVRVVALGEGHGDPMSDYGWIVDLKTGRTTWKMSYRHSRHAGGAQKNRISEESIYLPAGLYMVYYRTDDSHASGDWNASPPRRADRWGISLQLLDGNKADVRAFDSLTDSREVLVQLTDIRDSQHFRARFEIDREMTVQIYAIGEGSHGEMYDYGWIENRVSREVVWIMNFQNTFRAGGDHKNRAAFEVISLPPGRYMLHYTSDDSHSPENWNARPPDDRRHYGISLFNSE